MKQFYVSTWNIKYLIIFLRSNPTYNLLAGFDDCNEDKLRNSSKPLFECICVFESFFLDI